MRRLNCIFVLILILCLLCSCGTAELSSATVTSSPGGMASGSASPTDIQGSLAPSPSPSQSIPQLDNKPRFDLYLSFLSDNYQELSDAFFGGISGIGFIDLDLDGGVEMLVFDAGASAAMGLQFFDIVDGKVECVSANMDTVGKAFGDEHMSSVIVNANHFDEFRLMEDKATGEKFFTVSSGNGAADFSYSELIRFGSDDGVLTLQSLMYKHEDYDPDTGTLKDESFKVDGKDADNSAYDTASSAFTSGTEDLGYIAAGALAWEKDYGSGSDGLLAMAEAAETLYSANSFKIT